MSFDITKFIFSNYIADSESLLSLNTSITNPNTWDRAMIIFWGLFTENAVLRFNLAMLTGLIITFLASYYLAGIITNNRYIKIITSLAITFAPIRIWYSFEWPGHANWAIMILFIAFFIKFTKDNSLKYAILAGLSFGFSFYIHPYQSVMIACITGVVLLYAFLVLRKLTFKKNNCIWSNFYHRHYASNVSTKDTDFNRCS